MPSEAIVYLNIYDLTSFNDYLYWFGIGLFHSAIESKIFVGPICIRFSFALYILDFRWPYIYYCYDYFASLSSFLPWFPSDEFLFLYFILHCVVKEIVKQDQISSEFDQFSSYVDILLYSCKLNLCSRLKSFRLIYILSDFASLLILPSL